MQINRDGWTFHLPCCARMCVAKRSGETRPKDVLRGSSAGRLVAPAASVGGTKPQREVGAQSSPPKSTCWGVLVTSHDVGEIQCSPLSPSRGVRQVSLILFIVVVLEAVARPGGESRRVLGQMRGVEGGGGGEKELEEVWGRCGRLPRTSYRAGRPSSSSLG